MKIFTLNEYIEWREKLLANDKWDNDQIFTSRRGSYYQLAGCIVSVLVDDELKAGELGGAETKFYTELYWSGHVNDWEKCQKFYSEDEDLFQGYTGIKAKRLAGKDSSRNNIIRSDTNCLTMWQFTNGVLDVTSRSSDLKTAGLTDVLSCINIAGRLKAEVMNFHSNSPHIYLEPDHWTISKGITRRKHGN